MNKPSTNTDSNVNTNNKNDMNPIENIHTIVSETASTNEENLNNIPQTTYLTDEELEHFRDILLAHRNEVVEDLTILYSSLKSEDSAGFNTSYSQHMAEHGTDTLNKEQMFLFIQRDEKYLSYIDKALERIKNKTYGICVASGKPIPKSRLEAVPITASIVTAEDVAEIDKFMTTQLRLTVKELMALAGKGCFDAILEHYGAINLQNKQFAVFCGKGHNGGDALVLSRWLITHGAIVDIIILSSIAELKPDTSDALKILSRFINYSDTLRIIECESELPQNILTKAYHFIIDGILGTGLNHFQPSPLIANAIAFINSKKNKSSIISIDIPTGIHATTGYAITPFIVKADLTCCIGFIKTGFFNNKKFFGSVKLVDIAIPSFITPKNAWNWIDEDFVNSNIPKRKPNSYKGKNGKVFIVAGSQTANNSMMGAAILATRACLELGAGYVTLAVPEQTFALMHQLFPEVILCSQNAENIKNQALQADCILFGCGLGGDFAHHRELLQIILQETSLLQTKLVIDADGINTVGTFKMLNDLKSKQVLLTPHIKEFERIYEVTSSSIETPFNPFKLARSFYDEYHVGVLLKGSPTTICSNNRYYVCSHGTEALATAGTGDILAGIISCIAAQGLDLATASGCATYIHGDAGRRAAKSKTFPPTASDVLANLNL
ncbi:hypothetical protein CHS0354_000544 [Potamilus streckersoni]|uniref:Multifunctional fusion protein n=1 Tax=Potamilus streckersoni TaxID=2493646 RepID=A0AAE0T6Y5_9BIVA|nr:hypothetical protein CHS0354_000544 [Potamilus streckersoni]